MPSQNEIDIEAQVGPIKSSRLENALSFNSKVIGDYTIGRILGKGSCAVVRLGTHILTGKQVAVKILKPSSLREQKEALREIDALHRLNHPHITRLEKVIKENGYICLILELGAGGELFDYIMRSGKLDEDEARFVFRQILSGVSYCHANLVAHRDLKPENLLLDEYGNIKISDFGLSNVIKPGNLFSTWCGSPIYTPPEVILHKQYDGISMDIWSLGVVLFVLVTGGMPWRLESNVVKNIDDLIAGNYDIPDFLGVSEDCRDLISMMLLADSSKRATLETIMNHKWVCESYPGPPDSHLEPKPLVVKINEDVFLQLSSLGYDLAKSRKALKTDPESPVLTTYHLLEKHTTHSPKMGEIVIGNYSPELKNRPTRSNSHPPPSPKSPIHARKVSCPAVEPNKKSAKKEKKEKEKEKGILRSIIDRFRSKPSQKSSQKTPRIKKEPHALSIVMVHNSPSPTLRRRL